MSSGLILLAFLAIIVVVFFTKLGPRLGINVSGNRRVGVAVAFGILVLMLWASAQPHK
jgi:hypothetical protein